MRFYRPLRRVLIPYFRAGGGHLAVAASLAEQLRHRQPRWTVRLMEPAEELADSALDSFYRSSWKAILALPQPIKRAIFDSERMLPALARLSNRLALRSAVPRAAGFLAGFQPHAVVATHWGCGHLFNRARRLLGLRTPLASVYTELGGGYGLLDCGADHYFAMSPAATVGLRRSGVAGGRIQQINPVVRPGFAPAPDPVAARRENDLPADGLVVLFNTGGEGISRPHRFLHEYLAHVPSGVLLLACGRNQELQREISATFPGARIRALGFRPDIDKLMAASDLVAGKCGTAFVLEAQATGVPFVGTHVGAPSERPNIAHAVAGGHGWYTPTPALFGRLLASLTRHPERLRAATRRATAAPAPTGAAQVADWVQERLQ